MQESGYLVRFVDVVLILLFGFISISAIQDESEIELPKSAELEEVPPAPLELIYVGVRNDGTYLVRDEEIRLGTPEDLRRYLGAVKRRFGTSTVEVRIRADFDAPIRYALLAARACDDLGLAKSLDVELQR